ncbi:MAG: LysR family transcriptional regulator [Cypionkella sp.]|uniref:LysR family transcriptional regulator n=1 Tax=Cypionkella sp. TaxID=2811411 RepID=UPI00261194F1|nr:LysR family transcriptional regulator [Cypionkella sp.]MDB5658786.1 LysR family transcriptional regulator [Cypionkella sp.]
MTDWRKLPPLSALRAFSAFAQASGLEEAGAKIGVTHAAISQQIRALEAHMGLALVERGGRRLGLTAEGRRLAESLHASFSAISSTIEDLTGADAARVLRITTTSTFAAGWLLPRLADFRARYPGIDLVIDPTAAARDIGREADLGVRYGKGDWAGLVARRVLRSSIVVVASPKLVPEGAAFSLADLEKLPWLQELGTSEATAFLDKHGLQRAFGAGMTSMPGSLLLDAARDGQGVAIAVRIFVEADLAAGRLRLLHEDRGGEGYFLVTRPGLLRPSLQLFCDWLLKQAAAA